MRPSLNAAWIVGMAVLLGGCGADRSASAPVSAANAVTAADFDVLVGEPYRGTLTYTNYSDGKRVEIRSWLLVRRGNTGITGAAQAWEWSVGYDDEPHANNASRVEIVDGGKTIVSGKDRESVVERSGGGDTPVRLVTTLSGMDDNKPAQIRYVYTISRDVATIQKFVRFGDAPEMERHTYAWSR